MLLYVHAATMAMLRAKMAALADKVDEKIAKVDEKMDQLAAAAKAGVPAVSLLRPSRRSRRDASAPPAWW